MRRWQAAVLIAALSVAAGPAAAQSRDAWVRERRAATIEQALATDVTVISNVPADVDGDRRPDALLELELRDRRAIAVARGRAGAWRVDFVREDRPRGSRTYRWLGVVPSEHGRAIVAARGCSVQPCRVAVEVFVAGNPRIDEAGVTTGDDSERFTVEVSGTRGLLVSDRGRARFLGLGPDRRLTIGPWAPTRELAIEGRPIATGAGYGHPVLTSEEISTLSYDYRTTNVTLRRFGLDGTVQGTPVETSIATSGISIVHAIPVGRGWSLVTRADDMTAETDDSPSCGTSRFETWRWLPGRSASRSGVYAIRSICEDDVIPFAVGSLVGIHADARGVHFVGASGRFSTLAAPAGTVRLVGTAPDAFLIGVREGEGPERYVELSASGASSPGPDVAGARRCIGTERAWACMERIPRPDVHRISVWPRGGSDIGARTIATTFHWLEPLPGDRAALLRLNTFGDGGHLAVFRVVDLASGRVGPDLELGAGFMQSVVADVTRVYATTRDRLFRIPWSVALPP